MKKVIFFLIENWGEISVFFAAALIRFFEKRKMKNKWVEYLNEIYPELKQEKQRRKWWEIFNLLTKNKNGTK